MKVYLVETDSMGGDGNVYKDQLIYYRKKFDDLGLKNITFVTTRSSRGKPKETTGGTTIKTLKDKIEIKCVNGIRKDFGNDKGYLAYKTLLELLDGVIVWHNKPFTIVSSNYAHHFSACLGRKCLSVDAAVAQHKLVINIDGHPDYGGSTVGLTNDKTIQCGSWGATHVMHDWGQNISAYYAVLGPEMGLKHKLWYRSSCVSPNKDKKIELANSTATISKLAEMLGNKLVDVYLTVDMDVYDDCNTHYTARKRYKSSVVDGWLEQIKKKIPQAVFHGFDVTGLPKNGVADNGEAKRIRHLHGKLVKF
jgi:hypothetical protein